MKNKIDVDEMPTWLRSIYSFSQYQDIVAGINDDDCAIIKVGNETIVISSDYLNGSPIALELGIGSLWDLGRLLVAANLSDLCGTGATPIGFIASIMMEKSTTKEEDYKDLMKGIIHELNLHNIPLIGGDSKLGKSMSLCGTIIGKKEINSNLFLKNNAKIGDKIWVSGKIGNVAAAIDVFNLGLTEHMHWAKEVILSPNLPLDISRKLSKLEIVNAGTDLSDGLSADLWNICKSSNVGSEIYVDKLPLQTELYTISKYNGIEPWMYSLIIGGDFQFIVTVPQTNDIEMTNLGFYNIGVITEEKESYIINNGTRTIMPKVGHRDSNSPNFSEEVNFLLNIIQPK